MIDGVSAWDNGGGVRGKCAFRVRDRSGFRARNRGGFKVRDGSEFRD